MKRILSLHSRKELRFASIPLVQLFLLVLLMFMKISSAITFDLPACLLIILIGILPLLIREKAGRIQGLLLLASYAAYLVVIL